MSLLDKFIPDRYVSVRGVKQHPFREALVNIVFAALAVFTIVGSAACAIHIVFSG